MAYGWSLESIHTESDVVRAIYDAEGNLTQAAKLLQVSRTAIYDYLENHQHLRDEVKRAKRFADEIKKDVYESILDARAQQDAELNVSLNAVKFFLDRKAKDRGYGDSTTDSTSADQNKLLQQLLGAPPSPKE